MRRAIFVHVSVSLFAQILFVVVVSAVVPHPRNSVPAVPHWPPALPAGWPDPAQSQKAGPGSGLTVDGVTLTSYERSGLGMTINKNAIRRKSGPEVRVFVSESLRAGFPFKSFSAWRYKEVSNADTGFVLSGSLYERGVQRTPLGINGSTMFRHDVPLNIIWVGFVLNVLFGMIVSYLVARSARGFVSRHQSQAGSAPSGQPRPIQAALRKKAAAATPGVRR